MQKHDSDEGKFQSAFDEYGHGEGNGKSRQSIYKHYKKMQAQSAIAEATESMSSESESSENASVAEENLSSPDSDDTPASPDWGEIKWAATDDNPIKADTIPAGIRGIRGLGKAGSSTSASLSKKQKELQGKVARWGFVMLDRLITWWGKGVTNDQAYELVRSDRDYDLLEETTVEVMDHYDISIPVSPLAVWGMTVGAAYVPPIMDIRKRADPNRPKRFTLRRLFRRKKKPQYPPLEEQLDEESDFKP